MSRAYEDVVAACREGEQHVNEVAHHILEDMTLRKRRPWNPDGSLVSGEIDLLGDDDGLDDDEENEDGVGCPLPSTPEDNQLLEAEVRPVWRLIDFAPPLKSPFVDIDDRST